MTVDANLAGIIIGLFVLLGQIVTLISNRLLKGEVKEVKGHTAAAAQTLETYHREINSRMTELNAKTGEAAGLAGEAKERERNAAAAAVLSQQISAEVTTQLKVAVAEIKVMIVQTIADTLKK